MTGTVSAAARPGAPEVLPDAELAAEARVREGAVRRALIDLAERHAPRVRGPVAGRIVRAVRRVAGSPDRYRAVWERPDEALGPYRDLPASFRDALGDAVLREVQELTFTTTDRLHRSVHGPLFRLGGELAREGKRMRQRGGWRRHPGRALFGVSRLATSGCRGAGRAWMSGTRYAPFARTSWLHALWRWAGVDPMVVGVEYVDDIPSDPRVCPVGGPWSSGSESCGLVGVDFLTSGGQPVFLEANFNLGISGNRVPAYPAGDPICAGLVRYALERGSRRIVHYPTSLWFYDEVLRRAWREQAAAAGLVYEVRDDPVQRSPFRRRWEPLMNVEEEGALFVNSRALPSPLRTLIWKKGLLEREIERRQLRGEVVTPVRVPRRVGSEADLEGLEPDPRFPDVIVKHSLRDMATGHTLWKSPRVAAVLRAPDHVAWEYVRPDRVTRAQGGPPVDLAFIFRTYLLITTDGPRFLGARKVVSRVPIPSGLPDGPVADIRPFVVNTRLAASAEEPSPPEMDVMKAATLEVGRAIGAFLRRKRRPVDAAHGSAA